MRAFFFFEQIHDEIQDPSDNNLRIQNNARTARLGRNWKRKLDLSEIDIDV
jgi:hypothetical protein